MACDAGRSEPERADVKRLAAARAKRAAKRLAADKAKVEDLVARAELAAELRKVQRTLRRLAESWRSC